MRKDKLITVVICAIFVFAAGFFYFSSGASTVDETALLAVANEEEYEQTAAASTLQPEENDNQIAVYICGAVKNPGVYNFSSDSRIYDAIEAAGGFKKNADETSVNQAKFLTDGEQIIIPTKHQTEENLKNEAVISDNNVIASSELLLNINQAGEQDFMTLTGIGQSKAAAIIAYRNEHGNFASIEDIMNVAGIKEGIFNQIKDKITI